MEEFPRKYVSRRLSAHSEGEYAAHTTAMRQLGVGSQVPKPSPFSTSSSVTPGLIAVMKGKFEIGKSPPEAQSWSVEATDCQCDFFGRQEHE